MPSDIQQAYMGARRRLFLLDYDGTLVDFKPTPPEASPTPLLLETLTKLTQDPANTVVVVSGRPHETLEAWLGHLPIAFAAEHGLMKRRPGGSWQSLTFGQEWMPPIRALMDTCAAKLPGVIIEQKTNALAWHCRDAADAVAADTVQLELVAAIQEKASSLGVRVINGNKVVEVQPAGFDKGTAAKQWLDEATWDFVFVAGDDTTDEDLFAAAPDAAFTIKVRDGNTKARQRVATPTELCTILANLTEKPA